MKVGKWQGTTCLPTAVDLGFCASALEGQQVAG